MQGGGDKERLTELREQVSRHNDLYYNRDAPEIGDAEYDRLYDELVRLEKKHPEWADETSPTQKVGGKASPTFEPVAHAVPMLSLEKATTIDEVQRFFDRCAKESPEPSFLATPKLDGLAVSLIYAGGRLSCGATRGDGEVGEDITANLLEVGGVPVRLPPDAPGDAVVRGEVFMSRAAFDKTNAIQRERKDKEFVSPRNAAAGTLRQLDPRLVAERGLAFSAYWGLDGGGLPLAGSAVEAYGLVKGWGFGVTSPYELVRSPQEFNSFIGKAQEASGRAGVDIDGIVLRLDDTGAALRMGANAKAPRALLAFKFPPDMATTRIVGADFQLGRSGAVTPVARLEPVKVGDVTVSFATLHNCRMLQGLGVHHGDTVSLVRAGDVIPKVIRVHDEARAKNARAIQLPENCPECGAKLEWESVNLVCPNETCRGVVIARLRHLVSRKALDIEGFADKRIEALADEGTLKGPADVFALDEKSLAVPMRVGKERLAEVVDEFAGGLPANKEIIPKELKDSFKERLAELSLASAVNIGELEKDARKALKEASAQPGGKALDVAYVIGGSVKPRPVMSGEQIRQLLEAIDKSRRTTLARVLNSLGFEGLGETGSKALAEAFGSVASIAEAKPETACFVEAVNYGTAQAVIDELNGKGGEELDLMRERGVEWEEAGPAGLAVPMHSLLAHAKYLSGVIEGERGGDIPSISDGFISALQEQPGRVADVGSLADEKVLSEVCKDERQATKAKVAMDALLGVGWFMDMVSEMEGLLGARWGAAPEAPGGRGPLEGMGVVVTGTLPGYNRDEAKELVLRNGGRPQDAVTGKTDLLVVGDKPGRSKVKKAGELGVRTVDAAGFLGMLGGG